MSEPKKNLKNDLNLKKIEIFEKDDSTPMGYRIKRPKGDEVEHKSKFLKSVSNFIMIVGATGTGKSTCLFAVLPCFSNKVKYIVLASGKIDDDAHTAIKQYCESEGIKFYYTHEPDDTNDTLADVLDEKKKDEHVIVIFDDYNLNYTSKADDVYNNTIVKVFAMLRSSNCSGIVISQSYSNIPPKCRENCNMRIVFGLGNIFSVRAFMDDITGMFFTGDNEKDIRNEIKKLYQQVYKKNHEFIVIMSNPPPQIRLGWQQIIYPPDLAVEVSAGSLPSETKKKPVKALPSKIREKHELYRQATELGFPKWRFRTITPEELKKFIKIASAQSQKGVGNSAPELDEIINGGEIITPHKERQKLTYHMRMFRKNANPKHLDIVAKYADKLVKDGYMTLGEMKYLLKCGGVSEYIDM